MANKKQLEILKQGKEVWNQWRKKNYSKRIDLSEGQFNELDLSGYDFSEADLSEVQFYGCNLEGSNMDRATLDLAQIYQTSFQGSKITTATFIDTDFVGVDFSYCEVRASKFSLAKLEKVKFKFTDATFAIFRSCVFFQPDFTDCIIGSTLFANIDLSNAIGLDKVEHEGPSSIGIDTLYRSKGKIPESFLRGCGVPDDFITYMNSLVNAATPLQFYSCFISYSSKDEEFTKRLHSRMRDAKLRVWYAPEDMKGGRKIHEQIDTAIKVYDKLLVVISEHSIHSEWVLSEVRKALDAEKREHKRKLFPIWLVDIETLRNWELIDTDTGIDLAKEIRTYHIPDFSNWKDHDDFEKGFDKLLKDLQADL